MTSGPEGPALRLTARWVAGAMGAALVAGDPSQEFHGVSIDTRTLAAGDLFIAIRGERFDGAEFAEAAIEKGAAGVVVPRSWSAKASAERGTRSVRAIEVDDTTLALQALGHAVRRESGTKVVAITGSAGKTTTKEVTAELLAARYRVVRNRGNLNNHIGLPLSLVELRQRPEIAVVELGMNHPGEISTLVRVAEPDVRVWTNVGEAHLGFFASLDAIADAKAEIFEAASPDTVLVANADDDRIVARLPSFAGRVVTFGIDRHADVRASEIVDRGIDGTSARITTAARQRRVDDAAGRARQPREHPGGNGRGRRVRHHARNDRGARRNASAGGPPRRNRAASQAASRSSTTATTPTPPRRDARSRC